ncbi:hypothetical protein ATCC90586_003144 [Pythium insidiosum]|nr:hypothetical protein ATCC90586_003144 [Pythium insidiosum]
MADHAISMALADTPPLSLLEVHPALTQTPGAARSEPLCRLLPPPPRALEPRFRLPARILKGGDDFALRLVIALFTEDERHWAELEWEQSLVPLKLRPVPLVFRIGGSDMFDVDDVIEFLYTPAAQYAWVRWTKTVEPFENARPA